MRVNEQDVLIALGSNLPSSCGNPQQHLCLAVSAMARSDLRIRRLSRFFSTPCFPPGAGPDYVNAAVVVRSPLEPEQILACLHSIESFFHRTRKNRWGARTLDLDLLAIGDFVLPDAHIQAEWRALPPDRQTSVAPSRLVLPHPRMQDRAFVLVPLADVAAQWRHPTLGHTVAELCDALDPAARSEVVPL